MTIRWKLNLSVLALIGVFLAAMLYSMHAVGENARQTRSYARMRELSQFTADIRNSLYQYLLSQSLGTEAGWVGVRQAWIGHALDDIDIQIRLAESDKERGLWEKVRSAVAGLGAVGSNPAAVDSTDKEAGPLKSSLGERLEFLRQAERDLRELRNFYDLAQYNSIAQTANSSVIAQTATTVACLLTVLLFLVHLVMVRRWLVNPIQVLRNSAEIIGEGRLDHHVPLDGHDELAQLARSIDAMAEGLARFQADLVRSRELSALGELCANVAHGLRNPLAAMRSTAQLAERRLPPSSEMQSVFRDLAHEADRMDQRITRLFQLSKTQQLELRATTFVELVHTAQAQSVALLRARRISLRIEDNTRGSTWPLDCEQLAQALGELITNAAHHSSDGGEVVIRGSITSADPCPEGRLEIQVVDQGSGMSPATLAKAFEIFFTSRPEGSGMGLTLVHRIIERQGGSITLHSTPGQGTTATILLARSETGLVVSGV